jgi:hypothetical protein
MRNLSMKKFGTPTAAGRAGRARRSGCSAPAGVRGGRRLGGRVVVLLRVLLGRLVGLAFFAFLEASSEA